MHIDTVWMTCLLPSNNVTIIQAAPVPTKQSVFLSHVEEYFSAMSDYPGQGYKMSQYGARTYNPEELKGQWSEACKVRFSLNAMFAAQINYWIFLQLCVIVLFSSQREEGIRSNHVVTSGGDANLSASWNVQSPKPVDLTQDTSYFMAKTTVSIKWFERYSHAL